MEDKRGVSLLVQAVARGLDCSGRFYTGFRPRVHEFGFPTLAPTEPHGHACGSPKKLLKEQAQYFRVTVLLTNSSCALVKADRVVSLLLSTERGLLASLGCLT